MIARNMIIMRFTFICYRFRSFKSSWIMNHEYACECITKSRIFKIHLIRIGRRPRANKGMRTTFFNYINQKTHIIDQKLKQVRFTKLQKSVFNSTKKHPTYWRMLVVCTFHMNGKKYHIFHLKFRFFFLLNNNGRHRWRYRNGNKKNECKTV